jgi:hypothetical protein
MEALCLTASFQLFRGVFRHNDVTSPRPTAPMSRAHTEVAYQIRRLGHLINDIGASLPDQADFQELRRLLYGCTLFCVSTHSKRRRAIFPLEMNLTRVLNARAMSEFRATSARCSVLVHRAKS